MFLPPREFRTQGLDSLRSSVKQTQDNPWDEFLAIHPKGTEVEGPIRNITECGLFIGLAQGVDGMVHLSDLDWNRPGDDVIKEFNKGDNVKAVVLDVDPEKERISTSEHVCQSGTRAGSNSSSSKIRNALVVRPSPQHLSRGNVALSTTTTSWPRR